MHADVADKRALGIVYVVVNSCRPRRANSPVAQSTRGAAGSPWWHRPPRRGRPGYLRVSDGDGWRRLV